MFINKTEELKDIRNSLNKKRSKLFVGMIVEFLKF